MNKIYFLISYFFLFFLTIVPSSVPTIKQVTGSFILPNSKPQINSITTYSSDSYNKEESNFVIGDNAAKKIFIKISVSDSNGYGEINSVKLKIVFLENGREIDFGRFVEYKEALFKEGFNTKAVYTYDFDMINSDSIGNYRIKAQVSDGVDIVTSNKDFLFSIEPLNQIANTPTGFVIMDTLNVKEKTIFSFIKTFLKRIVDILG